MTHDLPNPVLGHAATAPATGGCGGGTCGCGAARAEVPVLDVRTIPHAVRHAAVLGAVTGVGLGDQIVLVAPHDPVPLLRELEERAPQAFAVGYDSAGPDTWAVRLTRVA